VVLPLDADVLQISVGVMLVHPRIPKLLWDSASLSDRWLFPLEVSTECCTFTYHGRAVP